MSLRDEYIDFKEERGLIPFDQEGDKEFCDKALGMTLGSFCQRVFKELIEIEKRLDELEKH